MEARKQLLGIRHPATLLSMNNLAVTYLDQGRLNDAERLLDEVVEVSKGQLSGGHSDAIISLSTGMENLARTYRRQGRDDDAAKLEGEFEEV